MPRPIIFAAKHALVTPAVALVAFAILLIGSALVYRAWRVSGRLPVLPIVGTLCAVLLAGAVSIKLRSPAGSIAIYPDRIETGGTTIPFRTVTAVRIQSESAIAHVQGRPYPVIRRNLVADTNDGTKLIASDDLYDVESLERAIIENLRAAGAR